MTDAQYIRIARWGEFQHYKDRDPKWIKNYTRLLSDDAYLKLTLTQRGVLHGIWMEYARSAGELPGSTSTLSRRLNQKVLKRTLDSLVQAGFIELVASSHKEEPASPEVEKRREDKEQTDSQTERTTTTPEPSSDIAWDTDEDIPLLGDWLTKTGRTGD